MMQEQLLKKLHYKQGPAAVLFAPEGYSLNVEDTGGTEGKYAFVQLFVGSAADVRERAPEAAGMLEEDAVFWISYPKKSKSAKPDINRDSLAALVQELTGLRPVSNVAIDETWSALRFRHPDKVK